MAVESAREFLELAKDVFDSVSAIRGAIDDGEVNGVEFTRNEVIDAYTYMQHSCSALEDLLQRAVPEVSHLATSAIPRPLAEWQFDAKIGELAKQNEAWQEAKKAY